MSIYVGYIEAGINHEIRVNVEADSLEDARKKIEEIADGFDVSFVGEIKDPNPLTLNF